MRVGASIKESAVLLKLNEDRQLHIVVTTSDGHLYLINPFDGCVDSFDFGTQANGRVIADDVMYALDSRTFPL